MKKRLLNALILIFALTIVLSGCARERSAEIPDPTIDLSKETTSISVFYPTGKIIIEERRVVAKDENLPLVALRELFKAEPKENKIQVVLPKAKVNSVKVEKDGTAIIDFSREILKFPENSKEAKLAAFAAIVETLKQFENIKSFKITIEGKEKGTVGGLSIEKFWGDISLKRQPINIIRKTQSTTETTSK
ncbi:MAG: GerMN domain-containing protein [Actinobacteria bacterium]|nr:GerMN domain-containing protein [Actinomycetota bacterium]